MIYSRLSFVRFECERSPEIYHATSRGKPGFFFVFHLTPYPVSAILPVDRASPSVKASCPGTLRRGFSLPFFATPLEYAIEWANSIANTESPAGQVTPPYNDNQTILADIIRQLGDPT